MSYSTELEQVPLVGYGATLAKSLHQRIKIEDTVISVDAVRFIDENTNAPVTITSLIAALIAAERLANRNITLRLSNCTFTGTLIIDESMAATVDQFIAIDCYVTSDFIVRGVRLAGISLKGCRFSKISLSHLEINILKFQESRVTHAILSDINVLDFAGFVSSDFGCLQAHNVSLPSRADFAGCSVGARSDLTGFIFSANRQFDGMQICDPKHNQDRRLRDGFMELSTRNFNWTIPKTLSEHRLLTGLSYFGLAAIPLIASMWPGVRDFMNMSPHQPMPLIVSLVFACNFFSTLGHFIYSIGAPPRIKASPFLEFVSAREREFLDSDRQRRRVLINRSLSMIRALAARCPSSRHPLLIQRFGETLAIPPSAKRFESQKGDIDHSWADIVDSWFAYILVEEGAIAEYYLHAMTRPTLAIIAFTFYFLSGYFGCWIVSSQVTAVLLASGWSGPFFPDWWAPTLYVLISFFVLWVLLSFSVRFASFRSDLSDQARSLSD